MANPSGTLLVSASLSITGDIRNCRRLEIYGSVEGDVIADQLIVHEGGRFSGRARLGEAEVKGTAEGDLVVRNLIAIRPGGSVIGDVQYGRMVLDPGGNLSAMVRNVPPHLVGDFSISVGRGRVVAVTAQDIAAVDPDNTPAELTYTVSNVRGGHLAFAGAPTSAITTFKQADIDQGRITFVHDGSLGRAARFDVVVADLEGATSGKPRTVDIVVTDAAAA